MALLIQHTDSGVGIKLQIAGKQIEFGRDEDCEVSLDDDLVSQRHAVLEVEVSRDDNRVDYILQDNKSTNHTYVNDKTIDRCHLENGDVIRIGKSNFRFEDEAKGDFSETLVLHDTWFPGVFYTKPKKK
jgi:pSer/pThr/pTyr-binding forkhead associated (FHA) protein